MGQGRLFGVLVTYLRPRDLERTLAVLSGQVRVLDELVVVDNGPTAETEGIVRGAVGAASKITYVAMAENAGFPGALAAGIEGLLEGATDDDWIAVLDDDDPPDRDDAFADLMTFAEAMVVRDPRTAAVGLRGARFDWRRGLLTRVSTHELDDAVLVDCIAGNALPFYRVGAIRAVGTFWPPLFFSHEELELGLRLERAGYVLYAHGVRWKERRTAASRPDVVAEERWRLLQPNWRSYYSLRNAIFILRTNDRRGVALRVSVTRGILKPLTHLPVAPRMAVRALVLNMRACGDAWRGRLGRRVEPKTWQPRPKRVATAAPSNRT
jgi:GT2 family glycosyltransferase